MSESRQVVPLTSTVITYIAQECWKRSGIIKKLARYYFSTARNRIGYVNDNEDHYKCYKALFADIRRRLYLDNLLPKHLKLEILNNLVDFKNDAFLFGKFLIESLSGVTEEIAETCIRSFVVNHKGKIDKQQTIINLAFTLGNVITFIDSKHTAYYCVGLHRIYLESFKRQRNGCVVRPFSNLFLTRSFKDPKMFWLRRLHHDGLETTLFECCAIRGPIEAIEYFFPSLEPEEKKIELSRAAAHFCHKNPNDVDKIIFFYKNVERSTWDTILSRYFYSIMATLSYSDTYRYLILYFYQRVREKISAKVMISVVDFILGFYLRKSDLPCETFFQDMRLNDYDRLFVSIWKTIPSDIRCHLEIQIHHYINIFLQRNRFNLVSAMIATEPKILKRQDLISYVMMQLIVTNKESYINDFFCKVNKKPQYNYCDIVSDYITYRNVVTFITTGDRCANVSNYNTLLRKRYLVPEIICLKHDLLNDKQMINTIIDSIKHGHYNVDTFYKLLMWLFTNNTQLIHHHLTRPANKNLLGTVYKNHLIRTKGSIYTDNPFCLTDAEMQQIRLFISQDKAVLEEYCVNLMATKDFQELPKMLSYVFQDDSSRKAFMTEFFKTRNGYNAVRNMITELIFDQHLHSPTELELKITQYIHFKKYWILTNEITDAIGTILDLYVVPEMESEVEKLDLLPHESLEDFRVVCQENWETLHALITQTEDEFHHYIYGNGYNNAQYEPDFM